MKKFWLTLLVVCSSFGLNAQHRYEVYAKETSGERVLEYTIFLPSKETFHSDKVGQIQFNSKEDSLLIVAYALGYELKTQWISPVSSVIIFNTRSTELEDVEVLGSMTSERLPGMSGISETLNADHLKDQAGNTLSESMDQLPGVHAVNTGVGIAKPMVRGFVGTRVQVSDNGVLQEGQQWGMDHGLEIDQFGVEGVEVLTGTATLQYGPAAQSGIVRILRAPNPEKGWHGGIDLLGKSNNSLIGQSTSLSYAQKNQYARLRLSYQDFGDYKVPAESFYYNGDRLDLPNGVLANTAGNQWSGKLDYGWNMERFDLRVSGSRFGQKAGLFPGAIGIVRAYDVSTVGKERDIEIPHQSTIHDKVQAEFLWLTNAGRWEGVLAYQHNHREERSKPHAHGLTYIDPMNTLGIGLDLYTTEATLKNHFTTRKINWVIGGDFQYQENIRSGWEFLLPEYARRSLSAYILPHLNFQHWSVTAGVRIDEVSVDVEGYAQPLYNQPSVLVQRVPTFSRDYNAPSLSFGIAHHSTWINASYQFSSTSRVPSLAEIGSNGVHHGTFRHEIGNPNLEVESGFIHELSLYKHFSTQNGQPAFEWKSTGWFYDYSNYIYLNPSGRFSPLPDAGQMYEYTQSAARMAGLELHMVYFIHPQFTMTLNGEGIFLASKTDGKNLPFQPANSATLIPEWKSDSWKIGAECAYTQAQNSVAINERSTPEYFLIHVYAGISIPTRGSEIEIRFRVQNVTNQAYMRHISRYRILNLPEQGVNAILQVGYRF